LGKYSFPKDERLKKKEDFKRILREGKVYALPPLIVYIRKGAEKRKIGISVNKKVGSAVLRNRIKRLIREVYRLHRPYLPEDIEMFVIVRRSEKPIDNYWEMERILRSIWKNAKVLKDDEKNSH